MTRGFLFALAIIWSANARAECFGFESRWISKDINGLFARLVAQHAFAQAVPSDWKFDQIQAHDRRVDLRLINSSGQPRSLAMLLGGNPSPGDIDGRVFRFRAGARADTAEAQVLVSVARIIDAAVTDAEVPCVEPEDSRGGLPAAWLKRILGSNPDAPVPRWRAVALGWFELLILLAAALSALRPIRRSRQ